MSLFCLILSLLSPVQLKSRTILLSDNRADEKALKIAKTGKVTTVVVVMHLYGNTESNLITTSAKISAKKTKIGSNLKKSGLN
jgi:hypothetical protein